MERHTIAMEKSQGNPAAARRLLFVTMSYHVMQLDDA
jgi:hypothetical protein